MGEEGQGRREISVHLEVPSVCFPPVSSSNFLSSENLPSVFLQESSLAFFSCPSPNFKEPREGPLLSKGFRWSVCTLKSVRFWDTMQRIFAVVLFFPQTPEVLLFQCGTRRNLTSLPLTGTPYPWTDVLNLNTSLGDKEIIWSQSPLLKVTGFSFNSSLTMTSLFLPRPVDNTKTRRSRRVHASTWGFHLI